MARLYSRTNATAVDDPEFGHFDVQDGRKGREDHGGFDLPDELSDRLHAFHHRGRPAWETEIERDERLHGEDTARRRDPQSLYNAVEKIAGLGEQLAALQGAGTAPPGGDVAALREQVEALTARLAAMESDDEEDDRAPAKPSRSRKTAGT